MTNDDTGYSQLHYHTSEFHLRANSLRVIRRPGLRYGTPSANMPRMGLLCQGVVQHRT